MTFLLWAAQPALGHGEDELCHRGRRAAPALQSAALSEKGCGGLLHQHPVAPMATVLPARVSQEPLWSPSTRQRPRFVSAGAGRGNVELFSGAVRGPVRARGFGGWSTGTAQPWLSWADTLAGAAHCHGLVKAMKHSRF